MQDDLNEVSIFGMTNESIIVSDSQSFKCNRPHVDT